MWRITLKDCLKELIDTTLFMIQGDHACQLFNLVDAETKSADFKRQGLKENSHLRESISSITAKKSVMACAMDVDATLLTAKDHVKEGGSDLMEEELLLRSGTIVDAYFKLIKFSTTPTPFALAQMGRMVIIV